MYIHMEHMDINVSDVHGNVFKGFKKSVLSKDGKCTKNAMIITLSTQFHTQSKTLSLTSWPYGLETKNALPCLASYYRDCLWGSYDSDIFFAYCTVQANILMTQGMAFPKHSWFWFQSVHNIVLLFPCFSITLTMGLQKNFPKKNVWT